MGSVWGGSDCRRSSRFSADDRPYARGGDTSQQGGGHSITEVTKKSKIHQSMPGRNSPLGGLMEYLSGGGGPGKGGDRLNNSSAKRQGLESS